MLTMRHDQWCRQDLLLDPGRMCTAARCFVVFACCMAGWWSLPHGASIAPAQPAKSRLEQSGTGVNNRHVYSFITADTKMHSTR